MLFRGWPIMVHDTHTRRKRRQVENHNFSYPACIRCPFGGRHWITLIRFGTETLKWCVYLTVKKTENMFPRFGTIFECYGHPDGRTERHHTTAEAMLMCSIVQQKLASDSMLCSIEAHPTCRVDL